MKKKIDTLCFFAIIFSALGWLVENLSRLIAYGVIDNRFHFLPFIGVYGLIPFALAILGNPDELSLFGHKLFKKQTKGIKIANNIIYFCIICFAVCFGEIAVGTAYEKFAGVKLWDYSNKPFHFTDYTYLRSILGFGSGVYLISKFFFFPLYNRLLKKEEKEMTVFKYTYGILLLDAIFMMIRTIATKEKTLYWTINIPSEVNKFFIAFLVAAVSILITAIFISIPYAVNKKINNNSKQEVNIKSIDTKNANIQLD